MKSVRSTDAGKPGLATVSGALAKPRFKVGDLISSKPDPAGVPSPSKANLIIGEYNKEYAGGEIARVFRILGPSKGGPLIFWSMQAEWIEKYFDIISPAKT